MRMVEIITRYMGEGWLFCLQQERIALQPSFWNGITVIVLSWVKEEGPAMVNNCVMSALLKF